MPLNPEVGGTERVTSLVAKGLEQHGHTCLGILVFNQQSSTVSYGGEFIDDIYTFLKDKKVDLVINQIAYEKWLLEIFLAKGGAKWRKEGGKLISCLHFDPCSPSTLQLLKSIEFPNLRQRINKVRFRVLATYYRRKQQKREGEIYNYIYDNSDIFIPLSSTHYDYLKRVMKREDYSKFNAIGNPLTFETIGDEKSLDLKKKTVLVCARMSEYHKRITLILQAWKRICTHPDSADWTLQLVGDGPDLPRYKRLAARIKLKNVEFLGQQSPERYYREASILLLASSAEGWGLAITEALQCGTVPVVMNSSSVYTEIIDNCYNGYLTPNNNVRNFAAHCQTLISNPRRLRAMQQNALRSATRFSYSATILRWKQVISGLY